MAAEVVMEEVMLDITDLEVMMATMALVLVIVVGEPMVVVDQDMETKILVDMMVTTKRGIFLATTVVVETMILEITVDNSSQIMDPRRGSFGGSSSGSSCGGYGSGGGSGGYGSRF